MKTIPTRFALAGLPVTRACELADGSDRPPWLIEQLWADQAVGILGGQPKCCKSFLALDMAVSVAGGTPCLRRFPVSKSGTVLFFPAEDALTVVRRRIEGLCAVSGAALDTLPLYVITAPRLLLDIPQDRERLRATVAELRPRLLILDPFIRLHRADENASKDVAPLLGFLRELQRQFATAVLLVHHVRKGSPGERPGQALRGSSDLHGWGDSNLYLTRNSRHLILSVEHRAAPSSPAIPLNLLVKDDVPSLVLLDAACHEEPLPSLPADRVLSALARADRPLSSQQLRNLCRIRSATLSQTTAALLAAGRIRHDPDGYRLIPSQHTLPVPIPANL